MKSSSKIIAVILAALPCLAAVSRAQLLLNAAGTYAQGFDTLPATGTIPWVNNTTLAGWYAQREAGSLDLVASTGSSSGGAFYNFGSTGSGDRALGSIGSTGTGDVAWAVIFKNTSGGTLTFFDFTFTGELWRRGATGKVDTIEFDYRIGTVAATDLLATAGWTAVNALDFSNPNTPGGSGALDGNSVANRTTLSANLNLALAPGQFVTFRWLDIDQTGTDNGLAIDNVSISYAATTTSPAPVAVPEVSAYGWAAAGALAVLIFRQRRNRPKN